MLKNKGYQDTDSQKGFEAKYRVKKENSIILKTTMATLHTCKSN